jgi:hypothetical protein
LAEAALHYVHIDPHVAVEIGNHAFDIAVRGLAAGWGFEAVEAVDLAEVMSQLEAHPHDMAHPSLYFELDDRTRHFRMFGDEDRPWFVPPLGIEDVISAVEVEWDSKRAAMNYCEELVDVIGSYRSKVPYLSLKECLVQHWGQFQMTLADRREPIVLPDLDEKMMEFIEFFPGETVDLPSPEGRGPLSQVRLSEYLSSQELSALMDLLAVHCGPLPGDLVF